MSEEQVEEKKEIKDSPIKNECPKCHKGPFKFDIVKLYHDKPNVRIRCIRCKREQILTADQVVIYLQLNKRVVPKRIKQQWQPE